MKMTEKIILILPEIYDIKFYHNVYLIPPLTLLRLAGELIKQNIEVIIIDQKVEPTWQEIIKKEMQNPPLFIGISSLCGGQIKYALQTSQFIKNNWNIPVVWGGAMATLEPLETAKHELVDIAVIGEAETTILEIKDYFLGKISLDKIKGIAYKKNDTVILNKPRETPTDLNALPLLPLHLIDLKKYEKDYYCFNFSENRYISLETSRGCPYKCTFCYESSQAHGWREMKPEKIVEQIIDIIDKYNIYNFVISDDNFFIDFARAEKIFQSLKEKNIHISWSGAASLNLVLAIDKEKIQNLKELGCVSLIVGIDSGSKEILKRTNKKYTVEDIDIVGKKMLNTDIRLSYSFIVGFPFDTLQTVKTTFAKTATMFLENDNLNMALYTLMPFPKTGIFTECVEKGFIVPQTLEEWSTITNPLLPQNSVWIDKDVLKFINQCSYIQDLLIANNFSRGIVKFITNLILKSCLRILLKRVQHDYFQFWIESFIMLRLLSLTKKIREIVTGQSINTED